MRSFISFGNCTDALARNIKFPIFASNFLKNRPAEILERVTRYKTLRELKEKMCLCFFMFLASASVQLPNELNDLMYARG